MRILHCYGAPVDLVDLSVNPVDLDEVTKAQGLCRIQSNTGKNFLQRRLCSEAEDQRCRTRCRQQTGNGLIVDKVHRNEDGDQVDHQSYAACNEDRHRPSSVV